MPSSRSSSSAVATYSFAGPLLALVLGAALGVGIWVTHPAAPADAEPVATGPLIVLTGNEKGFIRPCGCSKPALGGVHRRATVLGKLREKEPGLSLVSLGDLVLEGGQQQRTKFETFLMSMEYMGYQAYAPGAGEFQLGVDYLAGMKTFGECKFVGLNVWRAGERFFEPSFRLGDSAFVVTGLVETIEGVADIEVRPAADALKTWLETLDAKKDRPIVLFNGTEKGVLALAATVPEAWRARTVIAFGGGYDGPARLDKTPLPVISVGSKGRFLAYLRPDAKPMLSSFRLEEEIEGQEDVSMMLDGYRQSLADEKLVEKFPRRPIELKYVGDAACIECHEDSCKTLDPTPHERAWASIKYTNDHHDPECVSCHVTGWGDSTGFLSEVKTPKLLNVTCEACHGPGERHVDLQDPTPGGKLGPEFCKKCHDADNSPHFDFKKYWPKIAHPPKEDGGKGK